MPHAVLATKLFIPPTRPQWVTRARLLNKLNDGLRGGCRLALISAPAGFGKTTLVTDWLASLNTGAAGCPKAAWLSLDAGDNDLAVFLGYLAAAVQRCQPSAGERTLRLLENSPLPPAEALLLPLVNDLAAEADPGAPFLLALDDYHAVQLPAIHEAVAFLIERMPPTMQVIITTRQDPLLPLSRWRARGLLNEVRLKDLRFTEAEAAEFLNHSMGLGLSAEDVAALASRTEGWAVGLQLAAVSLMEAGAEDDAPARTESIRSELVRSFTGNDRYVMDYLIDEVLGRQPEDVQRFLLHTSVLDRFNSALCEAVLAGDDAGAGANGSENGTTAAPHAILEYLERANLFLIPLDNRREWFRYHHLFAELLQHRLRVIHGAERAPQLLRRASAWFGEQGQAGEAIQYALRAGDWALSSRWILEHAPRLMRAGESMTLLRWLRALPEGVVRASAELCHVYGYLLSVTGKLELGRAYLELAEAGFAGQPDRLGSTLAFASYNACFMGEFEREIELAARALDLLDEDNHWMRGVASVSLGLGLCHTGDPQGCEEAMQEALEAGQRSGTVRTCVLALAGLGRMAVLRLDFARAEACFRQAIEHTVTGRSFSGADQAYFDLVQLLYEQNRLDEAAQVLEQGLEVNQLSGNIEMRAYGYRQAARLHQLNGQRESAAEYLQKALRLAGEFNLSPLTLSLNAACQVEMALWDGSLPEAERAAPRVTNSLGLFAFNFYPEMARARLLIAKGCRAEALRMLEPALPRAEQPGWEYPRLQMRVLQALADPQPDKARAYLRDALALAEGTGAAAGTAGTGSAGVVAASGSAGASAAPPLRCFLDLGDPMRALLLDLRPLIKPAQSAFADRVLSAFGPAAPSAAAAAAQQALPEPLTDRELEVLRLLADGLSIAEIAARLYLSPNTLKAHTQNIYSKLDVHSRMQGVNKARELGLIE